MLRPVEPATIEAKETRLPSCNKQSTAGQSYDKVSDYLRKVFRLAVRQYASNDTVGSHATSEGDQMCLQQLQ